MERLFTTVPHVDSFHNGGAIDPQYYARHMVEAVLRIRLNNEADAYCLFRIAATHPAAAANLLQYLHEEYGHDDMLAPDLEAFGISGERLNSTQPLFATELLMAYLRYAADKDGPLASFVWNWLVEWYSHRYNPGIVARAGQAFGTRAVEGTGRHLEIDRDFDHEAGIGDALLELVSDDATMERALLLVDRFIQLIGLYFDELHKVTIGQRAPAP